MTISERVALIVERRFLRPRGLRLGPGDSLVAHGALDSLGMLELVTLLETAFGVRIPDGEVVAENLDSIAGIVTFLEGKGVTGVSP
jgi:acyl carrier protein